MSQETLNTIVGQLVAAGVHEPQGAGDFHGDDRPVTLHDHPLHGLWLGLTVELQRGPRGGHFDHWFCRTRTECFGARSPYYQDCHLSGRVARDISDWPDGAVRGWLEDVCESVGWRLTKAAGVGSSAYSVSGDSWWVSADTPLEALGAAVTKVLGGAG